MLRKHVISTPCRRAKQTCCVSSRQFSQGSSHASYLDVGLRDFVTHPFRPSTHPFMHPLCMPIIVEVASLTLSASCIWSLQSQRFRNRLKLQSQRFRSQKEVCGRIPVLRLESFVILPAPVIFYAPIIYSGVVRVICALCLRVLL